MTIDPAFDPLKERLQRAVAPDYRVEHRIGGGKVLGAEPDWTGQGRERERRSERASH